MHRATGTCATGTCATGNGRVAGAAAVGVTPDEGAMEALTATLGTDPPQPGDRIHVTAYDLSQAARERLLAVVDRAAATGRIRRDPLVTFVLTDRVVAARISPNLWELRSPDAARLGDEVVAAMWPVGHRLHTVDSVLVLVRGGISTADIREARAGLARVLPQRTITLMSRDEAPLADDAGPASGAAGVASALAAATTQPVISTSARVTDHERLLYAVTPRSGLPATAQPGIRAHGFWRFTPAAAPEPVGWVWPPPLIRSQIRDLPPLPPGWIYRQVPAGIVIAPEIVAPEIVAPEVVAPEVVAPEAEAAEGSVAPDGDGVLMNGLLVPREALEERAPEGVFGDGHRPGPRSRPAGGVSGRGTGRRRRPSPSRSPLCAREARGVG